MRINDDEVKGNVDKAAGTVKQNIGRALGDPILESEGADQRTGGDIQAGFGKARRKVGEVVEDLGEKLGK
jgi:uncharacterized protein YjbJ (UPF0337 family)